MVVVGDTESGKTNLLRLMAKAIMDRYTPAEARSWSSTTAVNWSKRSRRSTASATPSPSTR